MTPPCQVFPSPALESEIQKDLNGRKRKGGDINLSKCQLFSMLQYECTVDQPELMDSRVKCWPVQRWFRKCRDKRGTFMVETTNWEKTMEPASVSMVNGTAEDASDGKWMQGWRET